MTAATNNRGLRIWQGIEATEPPVRRHDYADLLRMAQRMLDERRKRFPAMVAAGQLAQAEADREIATFEDLVADWRFIVTGEGEPASLMTLVARCAALDASLRTIADIARQERGFSATLGRQAECVIALRWHLEPGRETIALARLTHQLRADAAAAQSREPAQCH